MSVSHLKACRKSFMSHLVDIPKIIALFFGASSIKGIVIFLELWFHLIEGFHPIHSKEWPFSLLLPIVSLTTFSLLFHSTSLSIFSFYFLHYLSNSTLSLNFFTPVSLSMCLSLQQKMIFLVVEMQSVSKRGVFPTAKEGWCHRTVLQGMETKCWKKTLICWQI